MEEFKHNYNSFDEFIMRMMADGDERTYHHPNYTVRNVRQHETGYDVMAKYLNKCLKLSGNHFVTEFVAFFEYKYMHEDNWSLASELVLIDDDNTQHTWVNDWWEGQECFRNIHIVPLRYVMNYYQDYVLHM